MKTNTVTIAGRSRFRKFEFVADAAINTFMLVVCFAMLYPFLYCLAYSLSDSGAAMVKPITFLPVKFTLSNYEEVFKNPILLSSFIMSVARTAGGVIFSGLILSLAAFATTKADMPGIKAITVFLIIPMYFSGGLPPTYVLISKLGLFNNFLVYILPYGFWAFNMLIMRTFYNTLPPSLEESAKIDGASDLKIFLKIIFPLSMPVMATIAMFNGVFHWNAWFDVMLYITKRRMYPLSYMLQMILKEAYATQLLASQGQVSAISSHTQTSPQSLQMATLIVSVVPIVLIYPFLQKYFIKGFMIGAVKG